MADLTLKILLEGVDKLTGPLKSGAKAAEGLKIAVGEDAKALKDLDRATSALDGFGDKTDRAREKANGLKAAMEAATRLKAAARYADRTEWRGDALRGAVDAGGRVGAGRTVEHKTAVAELERLRETTKKLDGFEALRAKVSASAAALGAAREEASRLGREHAALSNPTKKQTAAFERARKAVNDLEGAHRAQVVQVQTARAELARMGVALKGGVGETTSLELHQRKLKAAIADTTVAAAKQAAAIEAAAERERAAQDKAAAATRKRAEAQERLDRTLQRASAVAVTGAAAYGTGRTALGAMAGAAMPGIDYQAQMSKVGALVGLDKTSAEYAKLDALAIKLGADTAFSAGQAAEGMGFLAQSGFKAAEILKTMPGMLDLARAGSAEVGETADIAANILRGFGLEASQMGEVGDVLAHTFTHSNTTLQTLGETMKYIAPVAKGLKFSLGDMSVMAGLLGNVGIKGSEAGTALRAMMVRLAAPPVEAEKALAKLGVGTKTATGDLRPMADVLADLAEKTKQMGTADKTDVLSKIFGVEAAAAGLELVAQGAEGIRAAAKALNAEGTGTSGRIAGQMADNLKGDLDSLSGSVETLGIVVQALSDGPLRALTQKATAVVNAVTDWTKRNPELTATLTAAAAAIGAALVVVGALGVAVAGVLGPLAMAKFAVAALAPGVWSLGRAALFGAWSVARFAAGLAASLVGSAISGAVQGVSLLGGAFLSLGRTILLTAVPALWSVFAALAANPITWIVAGIAGAVYLIYRHWDAVGPWFGKLWGDTKAIFGGFKDFLGGIFTGDLGRAWEGIKGIFGGYRAYFDDLTGGVKGAFLGLLGWIDGVFGTDLKGMFNSVTKSITTAFDAMLAPIKAVFDKILAGVKPVMDAVDTVLGWVGVGDDAGGASRPVAKPPGARRGGNLVPANGDFPVANTNIPAGDIRTASTAAASAKLSGAAALNQTTYNEITINAPPGASPDDLARTVSRELDKRERARASAVRSSYADGH